MESMERAIFIQEAIILVGAGIFLETENSFVYYTGLDMVWATKTLQDWWINGEYVECPVAWAYQTC